MDQFWTKNGPVPEIWYIKRAQHGVSRYHETKEAPISNLHGLKFLKKWTRGKKLPLFFPQIWENIWGKIFFLGKKHAREQRDMKLIPKVWWFIIYRKKKEKPEIVGLDEEEEDPAIFPIDISKKLLNTEDTMRRKIH